MRSGHFVTKDANLFELPIGVDDCAIERSVALAGAVATGVAFKRNALAGSTAAGLGCAAEATGTHAAIEPAIIIFSLRSMPPSYSTHLNTIHCVNILDGQSLRVVQR